MSSEPQATNGIEIEVFGLTDVGRIRKNNQDYFELMDLSTGAKGTGPEVRTHGLGPKGTLLLVSDGMGGEAAGDVASRRSVETVIEEMAKWSPEGVDGDRGAAFAAALEASVQRGNEVVSRESDENPAYRGMGATMTAVGVFEGVLYTAQVGDSRCYLTTGDGIRQLTRDQSLVGQLLVEGRITKEEAERHPHRNIILQALGKAPVVHCEVLRLPLRRGDGILICSDGLSGLVRDEELERKLVAPGELPDICRELVVMANDRGGSDNITAVVARFGGEGLPEAVPGEARVPDTIKEFNFAGEEEEEEETQETYVVPETTPSVAVEEIAAVVEESRVEDLPAPPPMPTLAGAPRPFPVAVPGFAMLMVLVTGLMAGIALARVMGPREEHPFVPPPAGWEIPPAATPEPEGASVTVTVGSDDEDVASPEVGGATVDETGIEDAEPATELVGAGKMDEAAASPSVEEAEDMDALVEPPEADPEPTADPAPATPADSMPEAGDAGPSPE